MSQITCCKCGLSKPLSEFSPSAPMWPERKHWCRPCDRSRMQIARHGLTATQRKLIAQEQGGCRICGHDDPGPKGWVIDHDRSCCPGDKSCPKCRRGVLCCYCNMALGSAFDRAAILRAAADYLDAQRTCSWHHPIACDPRLCAADEVAA